MILSISNSGTHDSNSETGRASNILSADVVLKGSIEYEGVLITDGRIEGEIISTGDLTVGDNAVVKGNIKTANVTLYGKVEGNIEVTSKCLLKASGELRGDLVAERMTIEEGACFWGRSMVGKKKIAKSKDPTLAPVRPEVDKTKAKAVPESVVNRAEKKNI